MSSRHAQRLLTKIFLWGGIALALLLVVLLGRGTWGVYGKMQEAAVLRHNAETERDELQVRKAELEATLERLDSPRGQEEEIRKRFPLVKPGESEFVLVDQPKGATTTEVRPTPGLWERLLEWF